MNELQIKQTSFERGKKKENKKKRKEGRKRMIPRRDIERRRSDTRLAISPLIVFCAFTLWLIIKKKRKKKLNDGKKGKAITSENCMHKGNRRRSDMIDGSIEI